MRLILLTDRGKMATKMVPFEPVFRFPRSSATFCFANREQKKKWSQKWSLRAYVLFRSMFGIPDEIDTL